MKHVIAEQRKSLNEKKNQGVVEKYHLECLNLGLELFECQIIDINW